ncbi:MAG: hypothetical protein ACW98K_10320 [Candidatus Kariarchaeaceae archaeon]
MEIHKSISRISRFFHFFRILLAVTKRSLIVDFRYKFQLVVEATWTALNVAVFVLLGAAWQATAESTGVPYSMVTFFIIATGFFTFLSGIMETTVTAITEENQLGTMGFLVTNSVSPIAIILGRYISASVRWFIILFVIVIPPLILTGVYPSNIELIWGSIIVLFIAWLFVMGITLMLTSINLLIKRTTTLNRVIIYVTRFAAGAFIPLNSFDNSLTLFNKAPSNYLIWFPLAFCLEALRWLFTIPKASRLNCTDCISKDGEEYLGFNNMFGTQTSNLQIADPMVQEMFLIVLIFLIISLITVSKLTTIARKWGTIEFY